MNAWKDILIVIPTLNPADNLCEYVKELNKAGFDNVLVVDDGSNPSFRHVFDTLKKECSCELYRHAVNLGKGRAIKSAINYFLNHNKEGEYIGLITVDSDGQHVTKDVIAVAEAMHEMPDSLVLGCRDFSSDHSNEVPWKSLFGNKCTKFFFGLLFGKKISDTQTGLRGIPLCIMNQAIALGGERFEYETNMLIYAVKQDVGICEVPIETVYMNNNEETHFRPIRDSLQIYGLMFAIFLRYMLASLSAFIIDIAIFQMFIIILSAMPDTVRITLATVIARICSSLYNLFVNKNVVFEAKESSGKGYIIRYYILCLIQICISSGAVSLIYIIWPMAETIIKMIVDTILFFVNFRIQQKWVFKK